MAERERRREIIDKLAKWRLENHGQTTVPLYLCEAAKLAGWPSPKVGGADESLENWERRKRTEYERYPGKGIGSGSLGIVAQKAGWPTPITCTGGGESAEEKRARGRTKSGGGDLQSAALTAGWATPTARDYRFPNLRTYEERGGGKKGEQLNNQVAHLIFLGEILGPIPSGSSAGTEGTAPFPGCLNPCFARWLQGLPLIWDLCAMAIPRFIRRSSRARRTGRQG